MEIVAVVFAAILAAACVVFVARPFLREREAHDDLLEEPTPREREQLRLAEERDRTLAALKELEFDHRTGKISDADYREQVGPLRLQAAEAIRVLDELRGHAPAERPPVRANG